MTAVTAAIEPNLSFQALFKVEPELRETYLRLFGQASAPVATSPEPRAVLEKSARFLEILLVGFFVGEQAERMDIALDDLTLEIAERIRELSIEMYGLDPVVVGKEARKHLQIRAPKNTDVPLSHQSAVRALKSVLEICPIEEIEAFSATSGLESWGHRCRVAYDGIRSFVLRNDPGQQQQVAVVGHAYVGGSLSIGEVSTLLEIHPVDATALLESHGYSRNIDKISLEPDVRDAVWARLREDRKQRDGRPAYTAESVARDVVASERLEGVDARRWIARDQG